MPKVRYQELVEFGKRLLTGLGLDAADAGYIAEMAAFTQAGGVQTHGAVLLGQIESQVGTTIDPAARPKVIRELPGLALIDGNGAAGPVCMRLASGLARAKAAAAGVAVVSVRNTSWIAALGAYLVPLARAGFFAQLVAQSSQCLDAVPPGGIDACFSTNPMALAFPSAIGGRGFQPVAPGETKVGYLCQPIVADFSTAAMSMGKLNTLAKTGRKAPAAVFLTRDGALTDDPNAVLAGGAMLPAGGDFDGHKGYAWALWIEALTAVAGGSCNNPKAEQRQSFTLWVLAGEAFGAGQWYASEIARMSARIRAGRRRKADQPIRLPGERLLAEVERSRQSGVEIAAGLVTSLNAAADRHHVASLKCE